MMGCVTPRSAARCLALLLIFLAPSLRAEITPEAQAVLDRHFAAIGGRALVQSTRSTHMTAKIEALGLSGTTEVWSRPPDHRASETRLGPFTILEGYDGKVAWRTDHATGKAVKLDGKDLEDAITGAWFDNDRWLAPDQGGGRVVVAGTETDSTGTHTILEVTPPAGRPRRFFFDQSTWLVAKATSKRDQLELVTRFSDHRVAAGRKLAHRQLTQITGMPANDLLVLVQSVGYDEPIADSRFAFPEVADTASVRWLRSPGVARLPFGYGTRHLWLEASVNGGEPVDFLYDTGASITVIDSVYAAKIGLATEGALQGQGAGSTGMATFSKLQSLRVAAADGDGVEVRDQKIAVLSINRHLAPFFWRDCAGVIGYDFISRFVSEIDYDARTLTLRDPEGYTPPATGATLPFTLAGTVPAVRMKLDGAEEGEFRVDVGSSSTVDLHAPFVKRHALDRRYPKGLEVTGGGFGGTFTNRLVRMKSLELGPWSWKRPLVSLSGAATGAFASEDYAGNIGNRILERFKVTIDYERRILHLEPGARFAEPDRFTRSGAQLARFGDVVQVMQVLAGSPAEKAGLATGDRVLAIEGKPAAGYTIEDVEALIEDGDAGRKVRFEIERDGRKREVTIRLAEIL